MGLCALHNCWVSCFIKLSDKNNSYSTILIIPLYLIRLVHLLHTPHEDLQVDPDQGEQGGLEVNLPLLIHRHIHPNQSLVG